METKIVKRISTKKLIIINIIVITTYGDPKKDALPCFSYMEQKIVANTNLNTLTQM